MRNYKFSSDIHSDFASTLKQRVNHHFRAARTSRSANLEMMVKSVAAFAIYLVPFAIMLLLAPDSLVLLFSLWIVMGFGKAFIGTSVMHDALHGAYSKKKRVNRLMGISAWLVGIDPTIWKLQHNTLHHTYTNIEGADGDIEPRYVLRFSPNQPLRWFHRYQHVYAIVLYSISTLVWVLVKDFVKAHQYHQKGLLRRDISFPLYIVEIVLRKASYLAIFLLAPIYVLPVSATMVIGMFIVMHLTAGFLLSLIFQPSHVIDSSEFYDQSHDDNVIKENWLVHQLKTTTNFGMKNRILFWFSGGLNHQIEHHLFPNICHVHYWQISGIVRATAIEYGLPYHTQPSLAMAVVRHLGMLKALGNGRL